MSFKLLFTLLFAFLAFFLGAEARPKCIQGIYILPMLVETSLESDFAQFRAYLANCTSKLRAGNEKIHVILLSLENQSSDQCSVWSDCADTLTGDAVSNEALLVRPHTTYDIGNFLTENLKGDRYCLKHASFKIITNIRCQQITNYPVLNLILNEDMSEFSSFINYRHLESTVFWYNFDYVSPSDNIGCENLYGLKKEVGSMLSVIYSNKNNLFMNELTDQC